MECVLDGHPFSKNRKSLTKGVGTPGHVISVDGNLVNRHPHNGTTSEARFNSVLAGRERDARTVK